MTSKEALEFIIETFNKYANKPNDIGLFFKFCEAHEKVKKDLDELEELKKIMGTPIQEIMKRLKILEILKEHISLKIDERQCDKYLIKMASEDTGNYTYIRLYEEEVKKLLEEWLYE